MEAGEWTNSNSQSETTVMENTGSTADLAPRTAPGGERPRDETPRAAWAPATSNKM